MPRFLWHAINLIPKFPFSSDLKFCLAWFMGKLMDFAPEAAVFQWWTNFRKDR